MRSNSITQAEEYQRRLNAYDKYKSIKQMAEELSLSIAAMSSWLSKNKLRVNKNSYGLVHEERMGLYNKGMNALNMSIELKTKYTTIAQWHRKWQLKPHYADIDPNNRSKMKNTMKDKFRCLPHLCASCNLCRADGNCEKVMYVSNKITMGQKKAKEREAKFLQENCEVDGARQWELKDVEVYYTNCGKQLYIWGCKKYKEVK